MNIYKQRKNYVHFTHIYDRTGAKKFDFFFVLSRECSRTSNLKEVFDGFTVHRYTWEGFMGTGATNIDSISEFNTLFLCVRFKPLHTSMF